MIVLCCYWYGYYFDISFLWFFISEMIIGRILAIMNDSASSSFPVLLFSISFCTWWVLDFFFSTICVVYRHWFLWLSIYLSLSDFIEHCIFLKLPLPHLLLDENISHTSKSNPSTYTWKIKYLQTQFGFVFWWTLWQNLDWLPSMSLAWCFFVSSEGSWWR